MNEVKAYIYPLNSRVDFGDGVETMVMFTYGEWVICSSCYEPFGGVDCFKVSRDVLESIYDDFEDKDLIAEDDDTYIELKNMVEDCESDFEDSDIVH